MPVLTIDIENHIALMTLRRPEAMNAMNFELYAALEDAVRSCEARCIVITGEGKAFCAGDDVKEILSKGGENLEPLGKRAKKTGGLTPASDALLFCDIPIIAAVNGHALGWGMELALMADIRVASERARFGELFVKRGLPCDAPSIGLLAQLVGRECANELLLTGDIIDAAAARAIGLVSRVVPHDEMLATALDIAGRIAANPPLAVRAIKAGLRRALDPDWRELGGWTAREIRKLMKTEDARESAAAFLEKREPSFSGK